MSQYMYSIPHPQLAIFLDHPHFFIQRNNDLEKRWKYYHLNRRKKEGVGALFFGGKRGIFLRKHTPLLFSIQKGWGVYI